MSEPFSPDYLSRRFAELGVADQLHFACAVSGGADSMALVHALSQLQKRVRLIHVNHHLHPQSDNWAQQMAEFAAQIGAQYQSLDVFPDAHSNVEENAREARYAALADNVEKHETLLTAQHQDDQALTLLLQLLRGAGPAGLAAMPAVGKCGHRTHLRPLLDLPGGALRRYALEHDLPVIEDPSNKDERFARNYLRAQIEPPLTQRWPAFARTLARSAAHSATADRLLGELARIDAPGLAEDDSINLSRSTIPTDDRAENVLRFALRERGIAPPATARLREFVRQVRFSDPDTEPGLELDAVALRSYGRHVFFTGPPAATGHIEVALRPAQPLALPAPAGTLIWQAPANTPPLQVRFRRGGERYGQSPSRRLKHLLQQRCVIPWYRGSVPLVYDDERIVAIGSLWQDPAQVGTIHWSPAVRFTL